MKPGSSQRGVYIVNITVISKTEKVGNAPLRLVSPGCGEKCSMLVTAESLWLVDDTQLGIHHG